MLVRRRSLVAGGIAVKFVGTDSSMLYQMASRVFSVVQQAARLAKNQSHILPYLVGGGITFPSPFGTPVVKTESVELAAYCSCFSIDNTTKKAILILERRAPETVFQLIVGEIAYW